MLYGKWKKVQTESTEESEEKAKPEKLEDVKFDEPLVQTSSLHVSRMSALLDFYSDRAVAHASFFVASVFGIVTIMAVIQQLGDVTFVWLSVPLFFGFSYAGYYTLAQFNYYANISHMLSEYGLRRYDTFNKIAYVHEERGKMPLEDYMKQRYDRQNAILFPRKISQKSPKWYMRFMFAMYWIAIFYVGLIGYSKFWKYSVQNWFIWIDSFLVLVTLFVFVPFFYNSKRKPPRKQK